MNNEELSINDVLNSYNKVPKETFTTDQSQGKRLASPSQTVDGKGSANPLMAAALPKSRNVPTGTKIIHGYQLSTFDRDVYRTGRRLSTEQKMLLDNLLYRVIKRRIQGKCSHHYSPWQKNSMTEEEMFRKNKSWK